MKRPLGGKNSNTGPYSVNLTHFEKPVKCYRLIFYNPILNLNGQIQKTLC